MSVACTKHGVTSPRRDMSLSSPVTMLNNRRLPAIHETDPGPLATGGAFDQLRDFSCPVVAPPARLGLDVGTGTGGVQMNGHAPTLLDPGPLGVSGYIGPCSWRQTDKRPLEVPRAGGRRGGFYPGPPPFGLCCPLFPTRHRQTRGNVSRGIVRLIPGSLGSRLYWKFLTDTRRTLQAARRRRQGSTAVSTRWWG